MLGFPQFQPISTTSAKDNPAADSRAVIVRCLSLSDAVIRSFEKFLANNALVVIRYYDPAFFWLPHLSITSHFRAYSFPIHHVPLINPIMNNGMYLVTIPYVRFIMPVKLFPFCLLVGQPGGYSLRI